MPRRLNIGIIARKPIVYADIKAKPFTAITTEAQTTEVCNEKQSSSLVLFSLH
ncbi:hypothetical protein [Calothrix sp. NIES-2098]|uniref:hypothetical protein n=1 Tax=Calothrix sp. NIES-2098 TaxID=1954171 RepID=UPI0030D6D353